MATYNRKMKRRSDAVGTVIVITVFILIFVAAILFFRVNNLEIKGTNYYTPEEIEELSGIKAGDSLLFINPDEISGRITSELIRVTDVTVKKTIPSKVTITVKESTPAAIVSVDETRWVVDERCRVIAEYDSKTDGSLVSIRGLEPTKAVIGSVLEVSSEQTATLSHLEKVLKAIVSENLVSEIPWIDMTNIGNIKFRYGTDYNVELGSSENAEYKLTKMKKVVDQLETGSKGTIYLEIDGETVFHPE